MSNQEKESWTPPKNHHKGTFILSIARADSGEWTYGVGNSMSEALLENPNAVVSRNFKPVESEYFQGRRVTKAVHIESKKPSGLVVDAGIIVTRIGNKEKIQCTLISTEQFKLEIVDDETNKSFQINTIPSGAISLYPDVNMAGTYDFTFELSVED